MSLTQVNPTEAVTQADRLPMTPPKGLSGLPILLKGRSNYTDWEFHLECAFRDAGLEDLIDLKLPKPANTHAKYAAWHNYSMTVAYYLVGQLGDEVVRQFRRSKEDKKYVDDAFKLIRTIVLGHGVVDCQIVVMKLTRGMRSDYSTARQYIDDFMEAYDVAVKLDCSISPFVASLLMMYELQSEFPTWASTVEHSMPGNAGQAYTEEQFRDLCRSALEECKRSEIREFGAAAVGKGKGQNPSNKPDATKDQWKAATFPKRGVSAKYHAAKMRKKSVNADGSCGYCRSKGHKPAKCWYIDPESRPVGWIPYILDIWFYRGSNNERSKRSDSNSKDDSKAAAPAPARQIAETPAQHVTLHETESDNKNSHILNFSGLAVGSTTDRSLHWIYSTGSSQHLTPDRASLNEYHELNASNFYKYRTSDGSVGVAKSAGYQTLLLSANNERLEVKVKAFYQPDLAYGLLSADRLRKEFGIYANTKDLTLRREQDDKVVGHLQACKNVLFVRTEDAGLALAVVDPLLLHRRYGHAGRLPPLRKINKLNSNTVRTSTARRVP
ncbi:hypothetical protein BO85DRAFT_452436 [Aspergillus piperis CBS 112811]|uniref:Uncharacterized protein n=1 Tax=Aspergillus piperis CBS 112811 TaxID=1448313 RepID=A0A8G1QXT0_9EURO|nr:hypothetical protein BO85DRAFT_452436 [Aspergillus piperis CBS 112811]RAH54569.1 hypothetical protein BO85DRAFT_452436 [Aspergillus piperis CBS 112811]